jgi:hypothetical protein
MSSTENDDPSETDHAADRHADAMKDQLRKDVASWSAARSGESPGVATQSPPQAVKQTAPRAPRQKAKPAEVARLAPTEKKPFRMSYDGTTDRDYIAQRIKLGAR